VTSTPSLSSLRRDALRKEDTIKQKPINSTELYSFSVKSTKETDSLKETICQSPQNDWSIGLAGLTNSKTHFYTRPQPTTWIPLHIQPIK